MALSKEKIAEVGFVLLKGRIKDQGFELKPKEVKRDVGNLARKYNLQPHEVAEVMTAVLQETYQEVLSELQSFKDPATEK